MKSGRILPRSFSIALALIAGSSLAQAADTPEAPANRRKAPGGTRPIEAAVSHLPVAQLTASQVQLPPLPEGVEELRAEDFFKMPVGPLGLEPTARLRELDGKKVRLVGYFVFEDWSTCSCPPEGNVENTAPKRKGRRPAMPAWMKHVVPGRAMLAPAPSSVSLGHYGLSDDLPPQTAFIHIASRFGEPVPYRPGLFAITGTLSLGNREEQDGRMSFVRIAVENDEQIAQIGRLSSN